MFHKKELVDLLKSNFEMQDFIFSEEEQGVSWRNELFDKTLYVYLGFSNSSESFFLQHPSAYITINLIEDKMKNLSVPQKFIYNSFTCSFLYEKEMYDLGLRDKSISSASDFYLVMDILKKFFNDINQFFETINNPSKVLEKLNSLEMKDAIYFLGQPLPLRKTVLLFYVNFEEYLNYVEQIRKFLIETNSPLLTSYNELLSRLESNG